MAYFFYCPYCKNEKEVESLPRGTVSNPRDGFGRPIYHYECETCGNLDAGFMSEWFDEGESEESIESHREYFKSVISLYQRIRGFNNEKIS